METTATIVVTLNGASEIRELQRAFATRGWTFLLAKTASEARTLVLDRTADLLLVHLAGSSSDFQGALELARAVKSYSTLPVIMVSDSHRESDMISAFSAGVDDFILGAAGAEDLASRIETYLEKHRHAEGRLAGERRIVRSGLVELDVVRHEVLVDGKSAQISDLGFQILNLFMEHADSVLTPRYIQQMLEARGFSGSELEIHRSVLELQEKLHALAVFATFFVFVPGAGYIFTGGIHLPPSH